MHIQRGISLSISLVWVIAGLVVSTFPMAGTVSAQSGINPVKQTYVDQQSPNDNFGNAQWLTINRSWDAARRRELSHTRTIIEYDVASLASQSFSKAEVTFTLATFSPVHELVSGSGSNAAFQARQNYRVYRLSRDNWRENRANYVAYDRSPTCRFFCTADLPWSNRTATGQDIVETGDITTVTDRSIEGRMRIDYINGRANQPCVNEGCKIHFDVTDHVRDAIANRANKLELIFVFAPNSDSDLSIAQFRKNPILELAQATGPSTCTTVDMVNVIDSSGSMNNSVGNGRTRLSTAKIGVKDIATFLENTNQKATSGEKSRLGLVSFNNSAAVQSGLTEDMAVYRQKMDAVTATDNLTNIYDGIEKGYDLLKRGSSARTTATRALILLSDGLPTAGPTPRVAKIREIASKAKADGIQVFTIAIELNELIMSDIASEDPPQHRYYDATGANIDSMFRSIINDVCKLPVSDTPILKFCVRDAENDNPIVGAQIEPNTPSNTLVKRNNPNPRDNQGYLITGSDGKTNPNLIDTKDPPLTVNTQYKAKASAPGYITTEKDWSIANRTGEHEICLSLARDPSSIGNIPTVDKSATKLELVGPQTKTRVLITFRIVGNVKDVVVHERLGTHFRFANPTNMKLQLPSGAEEAINSTGNPKSRDINLGDRSEGNYVLSFDAEFTGPSGQHAIDDTSATIEYKTPTNDTKTTPIPEGRITKRPTALTINSDAWLGDKDISTSENFKIGNNTLFISGRNITGTGFIKVPNYRVPSTGKAAFSSLENTMNQRVNRVIQTESVKRWSCETGEINGDIYLNGVTSPRSPETSGSRTVWVIDGGCNLTFGNVTFHGTGTIINRGNNAKLTVKGTVRPADTGSTMGYISNKDVVLMDQSELVSVAVFSTESVIIAQADSSVSDDIVIPKIHETKLNSRVMQFPLPGSLRADITFNPSPRLAGNPPPLFEEFILPSGRAVP